MSPRAAVSRVPGALLVLVAGAVALAAASPAKESASEPSGPTLEILEPNGDSLLSGEVKLRARVLPEGTALLRLAFTADGAPVCVRERPPFECAWDAGDGVSSHHVRAVAVLRDGRRLVANVRTKGARFAHGVEVDLVPVAATVTDRGGRFVRGLTRADFRVLEDGVPQPVTHFIGEGTARELVVAVDMSGSMQEAMPVCRSSVKTFLGALRPDDQVTLLAFNDSVFTLAQRETDAAARQRAVDRLAAWGGTSLYDAVLRGLDVLERQRGRRALVLFSDGEDLSSHAAVADVERRVEVSAAPIYVIAQGRGTQEAELKRVLSRLSDVSGGRSFFTDRIEELDGVFAEITEDLANQYLLAYEPAKAERDGSWRSIKVEVVGQPHRVRARQGYRAVAKRR
jgi:Ca-activated chloride channel family protein